MNNRGFFKSFCLLFLFNMKVVANKDTCRFSFVMK